MSLGGERTQGQRGGPIPIGYGRGLTTSVADFATPNKDAIKWRNYVVSGATKDSAGAALAGVTVDVYETDSDTWRGRTVSNAAGLYSIPVNAPDSGLTFYARASLAGAPERAGTSVEVMTVTEL